MVCSVGTEGFNRALPDTGVTGSIVATWLRTTLAVIICLLLFVVAGVAAETGAVVDHAAGTFDVKVVPETIAGQTADPALGRMSIEKTIHGDLEGTSTGTMLTAGSVASGAAAYVAMEKVTGTLKGRKGSFVLMHSATMSAGNRILDITVAPGSGTDALAHLAGRMTIRIEGGVHYYDFDYTLPKAE